MFLITQQPTNANSQGEILAHITLFFKPLLFLVPLIFGLT